LPARFGGKTMMRFSAHGRWTTLCTLALAVLANSAFAGASLAAPTEPARVRLHRHPPLRVEVAPAGRLYRQCVDRPVVEHRPSGDTVVPSVSCRWAVHP